MRSECAVPLDRQGLKVEASGEVFWHWLGSSAATLPLALWDAAAAQKLPTEALAGSDAEREGHCRQAFSMVRRSGSLDAVVC